MNKTPQFRKINCISIKAKIKTAIAVN